MARERSAPPPEVEPFLSTTPTLALPYPVGTDPADVPADILRLDNRIEALYGAPNGFAALDSSGKLPSGALPTIPTGLTKIAETLLGADTATIDFASIPATYSHLALVVSGRSTAAANGDNVAVRVNADTTVGNYAPGTVGAIVSGVTPGGANTALPGANVSIAGEEGGGLILLPHYAGTAYFKDCIFWFGNIDGGSTTNGMGGAYVNGGKWKTLAAINRLTLYPVAGSWKTGSKVTLYGLN